MAKLHKVLNHVLQIKDKWPAPYKGYGVNPKAGLQGSEGKELVQNNIRHSIALQFNHHANTVPVTFIPHLTNAFYLLFITKLSNFFNQFAFYNLVRYFGYYDLFPAVFKRFNFSPSTQNHPASACQKCLKTAGNKS